MAPFQTGSPISFSQSSSLHSAPMSCEPGLINSSAIFFTCYNHTCASTTNELLASSFCLSRFQTWEEVQISQMFIPTIYLSPTCPFMTGELLASVCQSGKSSLANASLLASRFGKNRHCWKKCFSPTAVFESGPVWTKYFLRLSCDPFFSTLVRCRFINCWCLLVFCKQFCARSREMDIWKHKTVFCKLEPQ